MVLEFACLFRVLLVCVVNVVLIVAVFVFVGAAGYPLPVLGLGDEYLPEVGEPGGLGCWGV